MQKRIGIVKERIFQLFFFFFLFMAQLLFLMTYLKLYFLRLFGQSEICYP